MSNDYHIYKITLTEKELCLTLIALAGLRQMFVDTSYPDGVRIIEPLVVMLRSALAPDLESNVEHGAESFAGYVHLSLQHQDEMLKLLKEIGGRV